MASVTAEAHHVVALTKSTWSMKSLLIPDAPVSMSGSDRTARSYAIEANVTLKGTQKLGLGDRFNQWHLYRGQWNWCRCRHHQPYDWREHGSRWRNGRTIAHCSSLAKDVHIGNFVEVKGSSIGEKYQSWSFDLHWQLPSRQQRQSGREPSQWIAMANTI